MNAKQKTMYNVFMLGQRKAQFETEAEANAFAEKLTAEYKGYPISVKEDISHEDYMKSYNGVQGWEAAKTHLERQSAKDYSDKKDVWEK